MSYQQYRPSGFGILPPVVKNLLIINVILFLATNVLSDKLGISLVTMLGLHYPASELFKPYQFITYMFMHGGLTHIFFNMFALWMFGNVLENYWGSKRFFVYYMITGIGAGMIQLIVTHFRLESLYAQASPEILAEIKANGYELLLSDKNYMDPIAGNINLLLNSSTIGASGSVFGILLAFGMMFPNTLLYIYFAIPIKAKYFVILYGLLELFMGIANTAGDNVAHFAHLGGMLFGFILIKYWKRRANLFH